LGLFALPENRFADEDSVRDCAGWALHLQ
jgi:hypothetical protein